MTAAWPTQVEKRLIAGPAGVIEAVLAPPLAAPALPKAVICHPHSLHGGSMDNKVVTTLERALRELGLGTLRFNFRGVGASAGSYDEGRGEGDDLAAVVAELRRLDPQAPLWLAGFSFGSYVATRMADALGAAALITIAPPVGRWDFSAFPRPHCPWCMVIPEADEVVDPQAMLAHAAALDPAPILLRFPGTSHFFHGQLLALREQLQGALRPLLPAR